MLVRLQDARDEHGPRRGCVVDRKCDVRARCVLSPRVGRRVREPFVRATNINLCTNTYKANSNYSRFLFMLADYDARIKLVDLFVYAPTWSFVARLRNYARTLLCGSRFRSP